MSLLIVTARTNILQDLEEIDGRLKPRMVKHV